MYHYVRDSRGDAVSRRSARCRRRCSSSSSTGCRRTTRSSTLDALEAALDGGAAAAAQRRAPHLRRRLRRSLRRRCCPVLRRARLSGVFFLSHDACGPAPRVLGVHKTHFLLAQLGADGVRRAPCSANAGLRRAPRARAAPRVRRRPLGARRRARDQAPAELRAAVRRGRPRARRALRAAHRRRSTRSRAALYLDDADDCARWRRPGMAFGYHTRSHRMLSRLTPAEQAAELRGGVEWIRGADGPGARAVLLPVGRPRHLHAPTRCDILARHRLLAWRSTPCGGGSTSAPTAATSCRGSTRATCRRTRGGEPARAGGAAPADEA